MTIIDEKIPALSTMIIRQPIRSNFKASKPCEKYYIFTQKTFLRTAQTPAVGKKRDKPQIKYENIYSRCVTCAVIRRKCVGVDEDRGKQTGCLRDGHVEGIARVRWDNFVRNEEIREALSTASFFEIEKH